MILRPEPEGHISAIPRQSDEALISEVEQIRILNNRQWMNLVRLALWHAPKETKEVLRKINDNDAKIGDLLRKVSQ